MSTIKTRVRNKNDTKAHWDLAEQFKPLKGEIILYTDTRQMKVGDGETLVGALPFYPSGDVTAAGNNTFTGSNTFNQGINIKDSLNFSGQTANFEISPYSFISFYNKDQLNKRVDIKSGSVTIYNKINDPDEGTTYSHKGITINDGGGNKIYTLTLPTVTSGTIALTSDIDVTAAGNNTFIGTNKFGSSDYGCTISNASSGHPFCLEGNASNSMQLDFYNSQILFKDVRHVSYGTILQADMSVGYGTANATITLPRKTGTLALTDYVTANPTADGTTELTKLKVGDVVYILPSGGGSGDVTAAGDNTFTGTNKFTKPITTTNENGFIIAPGTSSNNYEASIWVDSGTLADGAISLEMVHTGIIATEEWTTTQLQGLFTYANNTLTINI